MNVLCSVVEPEPIGQCQREAAYQSERGAFFCKEHFERLKHKFQEEYDGRFYEILDSSSRAEEGREAL